MGRPKKNRDDNSVDILGIEPSTATEDGVDESSENKVVEKYSPEWSNYVLSLLSKEEMVEDANGKQAPLTDGLRRVAQCITGGFINSGIKHVHYASDGAAAVTWQIQYLDASLGVVSVDGSAEVNQSNTDDPFYKYALATAETRAEGRALKRLLGLCRVLTADETSRIAMISSGGQSQSHQQNNKINNAQIKFIELMCKKLNVDVKSVVHHFAPTVPAITDLKYEEAQSLSTNLQEWSKNPSLFSALGLQNFDMNWNLTF